MSSTCHMSMMTNCQPSRVSFLCLLIIQISVTQVSRYQKKHSPTHAYRGHQLSLLCFIIYYNSRHPPCSIYVPGSLSTISLQVFFAVVVFVCYLLNIYSATVKLIYLFDVNIFPILHFQTFFQKLPKTTCKIFN